MTDAIEMRSLILSIILGQYNKYNLVGMTYSVVKDGTLLAAEGYGSSNIIASRQVYPNTTLFREHL